MDILNITPGINDTPLTQEMEELTLSRGDSIRARVLAVQASGEATLRIGSQVIKAVLSQYVEPGRDFRATVLETSPRLLFMPLTAKDDQFPTPPPMTTGITRSAEAGPLPSPPTWTGRIISAPDQGPVRLLVVQAPPSQVGQPTLTQVGVKVPLAPGQVIAARLAALPSGTLLETGQEIRFTITGTSPQLVLDILAQRPPAHPAYMQNLVNYIGSSSTISEAVFQWSEAMQDLTGKLPDNLQAMAARIEALLQDLAPKAEATDKEFLARLINLMGLNGGKSPLQEHLARFLSEIHREASKPGTDARAAWRPILHETVKLFEAIDTLQLLNQEASRQDQNLLAAFPMFWLDQRGQGEILVRRDASTLRPDQVRSYKISLLLSLSELGRVKVDVELTRKNIRGTVWTEPGGPHEAISDRLASLSGSLEAAGLKVVQLNAQLFPQAADEPETLAVQLVPDHPGLIDVKV